VPISDGFRYGCFRYRLIDMRGSGLRTWRELSTALPRLLVYRVRSRSIAVLNRSAVAVPVWLFVSALLVAGCNSTGTDSSSTLPTPISSTSVTSDSTTTAGPVTTVVASTTTFTSPTLQAARWVHRGVGMSDDTLASSGDTVLADDDRVYVADGFGGGQDGEYRVSVFDAATGDLVWQRDDLTTEVSVDDVFLQALVGDILVVNGQYDSVTALESAAGEVLWSFRLPEGYGAVRSAVVEDVLLVGTDAPREGDIRPPIVYALNLADGSLLWERALAEGTDLQWHSPPVADGLAFVSSTLSHPRSASGNMIHAVDISTGEVRWIAELGGDQGFHFYPALISGELLVSWSPVGSAIAHRVADGSEVWIQPDVIPMAVDADGTVYAYANGIVELDPVDGTSTAVVGADALDMTVDGIVIHDDDRLILTGRFGVRGVDRSSGEQVWRIDTPVAVAPSAVTPSLIVVAIDSGVAVFDIP